MTATATKTRGTTATRGCGRGGRSGCSCSSPPWATSTRRPSASVEQTRRVQCRPLPRRPLHPPRRPPPPRCLLVGASAPTDPSPTLRPCNYVRRLASPAGWRHPAPRPPQPPHLSRLPRGGRGTRRCRCGRGDRSWRRASATAPCSRSTLETTNPAPRQRQHQRLRLLLRTDLAHRAPHPAPQYERRGPQPRRCPSATTLTTAARSCRLSTRSL